MSIDKEFLLNVVMNNADEGIAIINEHGVFTYYNEKMSEIEGLNQKEVLGKHLLDVFPSSNSENSTMLRSLRTKKTIYSNLQQYLNKNGKKIFSVVTDIPIVQNGKIKGVVEFVQDINKIKTLYESIKTFESKANNKGLSKNKVKSNYHHFCDFKTKDKRLNLLIEKIKKLSITSSNVLIYGETGTGKEIIAQSIHNASDRKNKPFIAQNCAAIPETLLESILFGTTKGSFTGATDRQGLFEQADGGTLLLDELNSMPIHLQPKLLRVLQEGYIRRVGSNIDKKVDVKVIATVNVEPIYLIENKILREDLFYRLSIISIYIPPLRERKDDILFLADYFINCENILRNKTVKLSKKVSEIFELYDWNGNAREMKNIIESAMNVIKDEKEINIEHLPCYLIEKLKKQNIPTQNEMSFSSYSELVESFERNLIINVLEETKGNVSKASRILKIKRQTLQHKIKKLNI